MHPLRVKATYMGKKYDIPDLPPDFVKWVKSSGRQIKEIPKDVVEAFKEYQREKRGLQRHLTKV